MREAQPRMKTPYALPSFQDAVGELLAAERDAGWWVACEEAGRYLALNRELAGALAGVLGRRGHEPIVEVCAGDGALAAVLVAEGIHLIATDPNPPEGSGVVTLDAASALAQYRPAAVIGSFVPYDAGIDEAVLGCPSVRSYLVLNARVGGALGSSALWGHPDWVQEFLPDVSRWMITRQDVWIPPPGDGDANSATAVQQHGEAWLFRRRGDPR